MLSLQKVLPKIALSLCLALIIALAAVPSVTAISYYSYLQQYLSQPQLPIPAQPEPEKPAVNNPPATQSSGDFWVSRAASRAALLNKPLPAPDANPVPEPVSPLPSPADLTSLEQQMLQLINNDRIAHGLQPLQIDMDLTRVARLKSQDIANNNYFAHESPTYGTVFDMLRANGISFLRGGENLSKAGNVLVSHMRLMNSTSHRANLLTPQYTHVGIGIVYNNPSGIIVTEVFIQKP